MTNDYYEDITKDLERLNWNLHQFFNEKNTWWDKMLKDVEAWLQTEADIFVKHFTTKTIWRQEPALRCKYPDLVGNAPVIFQWTLTNGSNLELAVKRLTPQQAKNFGFAL